MVTKVGKSQDKSGIFTVKLTFFLNNLAYHRLRDIVYKWIILVPVLKLLFSISNNHGIKKINVNSKFIFVNFLSFK